MLQVRRGKGVKSQFAFSFFLAACGSRSFSPTDQRGARATTKKRQMAEAGQAVAEWLWNVWPRVTHALDSITPTSAFAYFIALVWCLAVSRAFTFFKRAKRRHV